MGGSYYSFPCSILSTGKDRQTPQPYPDVPTTSRRISLRSMDSFQGLTPKNPSSWHRSFERRLTIGWQKCSGFLRNSQPAGLPEKVLIREEAKYPVTKNMPVKKAKKKNEVENGTKNEPIKRAEREEAVEAPSSQPVGYYLRHRINEKLIKGLFDNHRFNDSLSGVRVEKMKGKTYNLLPRRPVYEAILKKKITRREDIGGNFEIPCNIGGLKHMNALVDQGSDVNIMPLSTYMKLTDERPAETDIRLSLASHSYIYPLGIAEDILVDVAGYVYPMEFVILDIREDEKRPFILGTLFLTTAKAVIKFDTGTITLRSGKSKINFHRIPESFGKVEKGIKNDIEPIAPTMTVNRLEITYIIACRKFFKENEKKILSEAGDGVRIYPDGVVIFDEEKLGNS
ncbi:zinc finger, CCHC-type containing protein [Tanacetum coccineum]